MWEVDRASSSSSSSSSPPLPHLTPPPPLPMINEFVLSVRPASCQRRSLLIKLPLANVLNTDWWMSVANEGLLWLLWPPPQPGLPTYTRLLLTVLNGGRWPPPWIAFGGFVEPFERRSKVDRDSLVKPCESISAHARAADTAGPQSPFHPFKIYNNS